MLNGFVATSGAVNRSRGHISALAIFIFAERRFATDPSVPLQEFTCKDCAFNASIFAIEIIGTCEDSRAGFN